MCFRYILSACSTIVDTYDAPLVAACYAAISARSNLPDPPRSMTRAVSIIWKWIRENLHPELPDTPTGEPGDPPPPPVIRAVCDSCKSCREVVAACKAYQLVMAGWSLKNAIKYALEVSKEREPCDDGMDDYNNQGVAAAGNQGALP